MAASGHYRARALAVVFAAIGLFVAFRAIEYFSWVELIKEPLAQDEVLGTWVNTEGEGLFQLRADGRASLEDYPQFCSAGFFTDSPLRPLTTQGEWVLVENAVVVKIPGDECGSGSVSILSDRSIWGLGLVPSGDPDRPETLQRFERK